MWTIRSAHLTGIVAAAALVAMTHAGMAARSFENAALKLDKTRDGQSQRSLTTASEAAQQLLGKRFVNLDLEILIDGRADIYPARRGRPRSRLRTQWGAIRRNARPALMAARS